MNKFRYWLIEKIAGRDFFSPATTAIKDAESTFLAGLVKKIGLRNGDSTSNEFEVPETDLAVIIEAYNTDSYVRQGIDKYTDQLFKEGFDFFGTDENAVNYIKLRLAYMAEATNVPTEQLFLEIAEDVVKFSNAVIAKARVKDQSVLPQGVTITGVNGKEPIAGYFCLNPSTMQMKRDKNGTVKGWLQETGEGGNSVKFNSEDIVHIYYKREKGNGFGTPFLVPVLDDVRALRQAEENILKMMHRNIYPFYHVAVGDSDSPGSPGEVSDIQETINEMDTEGGLVTTNRVTIKAIAADKVINAEPYLAYLENRVFSGMGVPAIMFGRGNTANRSTGDNMTSEMGDRVKAMQKTIELFINSFIIRELLREGGYDPILNPETDVKFKFRDNDIDLKIKNETHAVFLYEHNSITEDEMRVLLGRDVITDRSKMHQMLITKVNSTFKNDTSNQSLGNSGNPETDNKQKPTNQHGQKTSPKKMTNSENMIKGLITDYIDDNYSKVIAKSDNLNEVLSFFDFLAEYIKYAVEELNVSVSDKYIDTVNKERTNTLSLILDCYNEISDSGDRNTYIDCLLDSFKNVILNI